MPRFRFIVFFVVALVVAIAQWLELKRATRPVVEKAPPAKGSVLKKPQPIQVSNQRPQDSTLERILREAPRAPDGTPIPRIETLFAHYPSLKDSFLKTVRADRRIAYAQFFAYHSMSEDEIARFCDIVVERERAWADLCARKGTNTITDEQFSHQDAQAQEQREVDLLKLLGPSRFAELQRYREISQTRSGIIGLNMLIASDDGTSSAFNSETVDVLARLCTDANVFSPEGWAGGRVPEFEKAREKGSRILEGNTLELFNLILDHQEAMYSRVVSRPKKDE